MRHFVVYHNTAKMGELVDPLLICTDKPVERMADSFVWIISSGAKAADRYLLRSVFKVKDWGETHALSFKNYACGTGLVFRPPVPIGTEAWFPTLLHHVGNFGIGPSEISTLDVIVSALRKIAGADGFTLD